MDARVELGEFLQARRARLRPEDIGLVGYGERRRVPGLRREELAQLAGVSVSYYTRLEQGQSTNASDEILEAIANALRLEDDERDYLMRMARPPRARPRAARVQHARAGIRQMLDAMADVPALLLGRSNDVLAWNILGHAMFAGHVDFESPWRVADRPNLSLMLFLDPHYRDLYVDWKAKARGNVADLHWQSGQFPDDARLTAVVGELTVKSAEFSALWSSHPVRGCEPMRRDFRHPLVGMVTLAQEAWQQTTDPDQRLIVLSAEPGSPSEAALRLLASMSAAARPSAVSVRAGR
jgi:transcriptional regulator with XRE-family HTH domain